MTPTPGSRSKRDARTDALARRDGMTADARTAASLAICAGALRLLETASARIVALYAAKATEVDLSSFDAAARALGWTLVYPRVVGDARVLAFHAIAPDNLIPARLGLREPPADAPAVDLAAIDAFLVPGAAFDRAGHRLGWGRGHYDATLAAAPRARRIGVAFDCQLVPSISHEPHDVAMHAVVTELAVHEVP